MTQADWNFAAPEEAFVLIGFDIVKAVAIARDPEQLAQAWRNVFAGVEGKAVLFDLMAEAQVLSARPPDMPALARAHHDGGVALASLIFDRAGVSTLERVAGLQAATTLDASMERAHDRPEHPTGGGPGGAGATTDGTESEFE